MKTVSLFMDVEDPVNHAADDAALDIAGLFGDAGVRGSFCVTGAKCRVLMARGRNDVIDALSKHCLGLHTNTHSVHPTTMELLADKAYEEGCECAVQQESPGARSFESAFRRLPSFWGGAGNTWSPEIPAGLATLGIPAYSYALTWSPNAAVHRFNGSVAFPQTYSVSEDDWARGSARGDEVLRLIDRHPGPWIGVFVGHPTRFVHAAFWDADYAQGRMPAHPSEAPHLADEERSRARRSLFEFLKRLHASVEVAGLDEVLARSWRFRPPTPDETDEFRLRTAEALRAAAGWVIHRPGLDPSKIVEKTLTLAHTLEIGILDPWR